MLTAAACGTTTNDEPRTTNESSPTAEPWFVDRAAESGLTLRHVNGMSGKFHYAEVIAPGVALFDYDNDGDLDVYLVQGRTLDGPDASALAGSPIGRLFRNDLAVGADGTRTLRFTDVTEASGIDARGYGMGAATGDFDNDGCVDLYLTSLGPQRALRNNCDGTFTDVSKASGTADPAWTVSAAFVDYDRDGWLDLFAGNYLTGAPRPARRAPRLGTARLLLARHLSAAAEPALSQQPATARSPTPAWQPGIAHDSARRSASPPPTSTATAGWTSTWPTTASRTCCG